MSEVDLKLWHTPGRSCSVSVLDQAPLPPPLLHVFNGVQVRQGELALASLPGKILSPARSGTAALIACTPDDPLLMMSLVHKKTLTDVMAHAVGSGCCRQEYVCTPALQEMFRKICLQHSAEELDFIPGVASAFSTPSRKTQQEPCVMW